MTSPIGDWSCQGTGSGYDPRPVLSHHHYPEILVLRVWLIVMFAGAGGMVVGSLASSRLLGLNHDASLALAAPATPAAPASTGPYFASKRAHEWLQKSITRGYWVSPDAQADQVEFVALPGGKGRDAMKDVAMADNGKHAPQNARVQF
jgi:hypothetical protein